MSQFEIGEARPGRPAKPDPFSGLGDIFNRAQIGEALTVPLKVIDGLSDDQKKRVAQKARAALKRYAKAQGGIAGEIGFCVLENVVELYFTKRKARQARPTAEPSEQLPLPEDPESAPASKPKKRAAAGAE